jgi:hypothetical protein
MAFDEVLKSALVRKALAEGEEQVGRIVGKLLSSEGVANGLQSLLSGAVQARQTLEKGVSQALHAVNLPSRDDVAALRRKLEELEAMIDGLAERVDRDRDGGA